jgi:carboxyl-terminal processing protease
MKTLSDNPRLPLLALLLLAVSVVAVSGTLTAQETASRTATPPSSTSGTSVLAPSRDQVKTVEEVVERLEKEHYRDVPVDDALSSKVFDRYLEYLDPSRSYLLAEDIREFEKYRFTLDDSLRKGNLTAAFDVFNRYEARLIERLEWVLARLRDGLDDLKFDVEERLELDRSEAPWLASVEEANDLWRRRLKNDVLNLRLTGKELDEIRDLLDKRYENRLHRVRQTKSQDAVLAFLTSLSRCYDPHTEYFAPPDAENFDISMKLSFEGIGALLQSEDEYTKVVRIIPGGPAEKSDLLHTNDRIAGVGQGDEEIVDIIGWRLDDVVDLIRGPKDTVVRLRIIPAGAASEAETKVISITRGTVKLEEQAARKSIVEVERDGEKLEVGVIDLPAFYIDFQMARAGASDYRSSTRDVKRLVEELEAEGIDALLIDLRGNGGGSLREANELTGQFIRSGPTVQVRDARNRVQRLLDEDGERVWDGPLAVLIDRLSASASEIFAGAMQDYGRGIVLGTPSFGKGTVQLITPLTLGQLKFTQAKFYRVSGGSTQHRGVVPDIEFPNLYDPDEIGESALDDALPWDEIPSMRYTHSGVIQALLPELREKHDKRVASDPDFEFYRERLRYFKEARDRDSVSLHEETRRKEREANDARWLAIVNERRVAKGEKPLEKLEAGDEASPHGDSAGGAEEGEDGVDDEEDAPAEKQVDPFVKEAAEILADYVEILKDRFVKR